ncbi:Ff.00g072150.m01.CDS01 [Fusarium sp. VM40]|nr:Ff.00g072150.m01.CDS01 [Fusarium sp. VM40]
MAEPVIFVIDDDDDEIINPPMNPPVNPPNNAQNHAPLNTLNNIDPRRYVAPPLTLEYVLGDPNVVAARPVPGSSTCPWQRRLPRAADQG